MIPWLARQNWNCPGSNARGRFQTEGNAQRENCENDLRPESGRQSLRKMMRICFIADGSIVTVFSDYASGEKYRSSTSSVRASRISPLSIRRMASISGISIKLNVLALVVQPARSGVQRGVLVLAEEEVDDLERRARDRRRRSRAT